MMTNLLYVYALCVVILFIKMFALSLYQGFYRISNKAFKNAEDARFVGAEARVEELPQVSKAARAWGNDLENIPLFWVLGGLCVLMQTNHHITLWSMVIFSLARIAHSITFLAGWQPWRSIFYTIALTCLFVMSGLIVQVVLQAMY